MEQLATFMTNHWQLWLALVAVLAAIFVNEIISQKKRAKEISTAIAVELMNHENAVIVDIRDAEAFRAGHIINAIHASAKDFEQKKMEKHKTQPIILICARGLQSAALGSTLRTQGFSQVSVLAGGIASWQAANLPLVKGK